MAKTIKSASQKIEKYLKKKQKAQDFDIENEDIIGGNVSSNDDDNSDDNEDEFNKKEHYVSVGKSKIREEIAAKNRENQKSVDGKKVSRDELYNYNNNNNINEESSSEEEEEEEEEESSDETFHSAIDNDIEDDSISEKSDSEEESEDETPQKPVSTYQQFSQSQSKDAIKGKSIIQQNKQFDSILDIRMQLQKAMSVYNTEYSNNNLGSDLTKLAKENNTLLKEIIKQINKKRLHLHKKDHFTTRDYEIDETTNFKKVTKKLNQTLDKYNKVTLNKWSKKTLDSDHNLLEHLDNLLLDKSKLISQLRQPKFNDLQFYKNLLNQLIQQKLNNTNNNSNVKGISSKQIEIRLVKKDNSGNKSSKGRKLDYTVQQKLLNFETPNRTNGKLWDDFKRDEFFVGLFGRNVDLWSMDQDAENSSDASDKENDEEEEIVNDGLKIFG